MRSAPMQVTAIEIGLLSAMINRRTRHDLEGRLSATGAGIGGLSCFILRLLSHRAQTISELSDALRLVPATLVPVADALERHGLIQRGQDPADRRRTPLLVTARGAELITRVPIASADDILVKSLHEIGEAKSRQLLFLLRALAARMLDDATVGRDVASLARAFCPNGKRFREAARRKAIVRHRGVALPKGSARRSYEGY